MKTPKTRYPNKKKIIHECKTYIVEHRIYNGSEEFNVWHNGERPTSQTEREVLSIYYNTVFAEINAKLDKKMEALNERKKQK